jgi:hypothetical protein
MNQNDEVRVPGAVDRCRRWGSLARVERLPEALLGRGPCSREAALNSAARAQDVGERTHKSAEFGPRIAA